MTPIALSLGDPAGIGPELIALAWSRRESEALPPFFAVGGAEILKAAASLRGIELPVRHIASVHDANEVFAHAFPVLGEMDAPYTPGKPNGEGARLALISLETATKLAVSGAVQALSTAPVAKSELAKVGFHHPGQTEFLAAACSLAETDAVMMLSGPQLRAIPLTVHCALADVAGQISIELIRHKVLVTVAALRRDFDIASPRIAVAGLNPHAGEQGKFGCEEIEIIAPAIASLRADGFDITGPHPADALFAPHKRASYDAAICMYHDQALIPVKALDFDQGVNVTLGLPIIRTSPDHGTAFDIAGMGIADPGAMIAAIRMAGEMAAARSRHETKS